MPADTFTLLATPESDATPPGSPAGALPEFESRQLLQGGREVLIRHGDECYRLRHTRNDKLILTK